MKQSAMVHKRPPAAGDSPTAMSSERSRVANINRQIAEELGVREQQVEATVVLLEGGATVPFVARYRKEITGALDDAQLRTLEERLNYLRELEERRIAILNSVRAQGKLDAALEAAILTADSKGRLEDIYLPFRPKRRTNPGFHSGVKIAVVDATGKVVVTTTIYPHEPARRWDEALATPGKLAVQHRVDLIAIGNGTASRETDKLAMDLVKLLPDLKVVVSEAGASVYSASAFASEELPELDVTLRGAASIARQLQDRYVAR
jgi:transcriptional accessory protein Tex/SPT6